MSQDDEAVEGQEDWRALGVMVKTLREQAGLTQQGIEDRYGLGRDTVGRIEQFRARNVERSTLTLLSFIFRKKPDYLENVLRGRPVSAEPELTLESLRDTLREFGETLGSVKADTQHQGELLSRIAPMLELRPSEHGSREAPLSPPEGISPREQPLADSGSGAP